MLNCSKKEQCSVVLAVTIGNILEWYEIYLFIYWAPVISRLFFDFNSEFANLIYTLFLFALGFLARPIGGVIFGRYGDRVGRKKALILSIVYMSIPTFLMGFVPTYAQKGLFAPVALGFLRLVQAFPAGGELPGAFCFLYESANPGNRRFMTSWGAVGNQIGIILSMLECYILENTLSPEDLINWGWRISFIIGGVIGFIGIFLRYKLHETPFFLELRKHHHIVRTPILDVIKKYKKGLITVALFCFLDASAFYLLSSSFPIYFEKFTGISYSENLVISIALLTLTTIPLPLFGMLGDKFSNKWMLIGSTIGVIALAYPLYHFIINQSVFSTAITAVVFILFITCITALIPYIICDLFPTSVRFTCVGLSFNTADAVIGGFAPIIALGLLRYTRSESAFIWLILFSAFVSLYAYWKMPSEKKIVSS